MAKDRKPAMYRIQLTTKVLWVAVLAAATVLSGACTLARRAGPETIPLADQQAAQAGSEDIQIQAGAHTPASPEPAATQETPLPDGASLLESHCGQCHVPQWLEKMHKPRAEWEKIVVQMQAIGVQLSDSEEAVLIDYLASMAGP
jgi:mono/diheme cytochrome c family protein